MTKRFVNTGPKAAQVGLPEGKRWRCPACTLLVRIGRNQCPRCTEVVTDEEILEFTIDPSLVKKQHISYHESKPQGSTSRVKKGPKVEIRTKAKPKPSRSTAQSKPKSKPRVNSLQSQSRSQGNRGPARKSDPAKKPQKKKATVRGFDSKGRSKSLKKGKQKPLKKLGTPLHKQDPKKLGYKPSRQGNAKTIVRSKLNHDTASYRGKFEHTQKKLGGKRMNIATLEHLVSKQGFNTAVKKLKTGCISHDERPMTPPGKRKGKRGGGSWITALQNASSTGAVASLRHKERYHRASHVDIAGKKSKFAL